MKDRGELFQVLQAYRDGWRIVNCYRGEHGGVFWTMRPEADQGNPRSREFLVPDGWTAPTTERSLP